MKIKYLINALPFAVVVIMVWHWHYNKSFVTSQMPSLGEKLADSVPQNRLAPPTESWKVVKIADGDTITVQRGSIKEKIRFCGIDAPESKQPLGQEAKDNLKRLIAEANAEVQLSIVESDRYGRKVAEVFTVLADGTEKFLQEEQLKAGLAYHYPRYSSNCPNRDSIIKAEGIAHSAGLGVWNGNYEKPWDYRKKNR